MGEDPAACAATVDTAGHAISSTAPRRTASWTVATTAGGATSLALVVALLVAAVLGIGAGTTLVLAAVCAVGAGGAVGTGMVLRGEHYPTDVVGGFCTAVAAVLVVALVIDAVGGRRARVAETS